MLPLILLFLFSDHPQFGGVITTKSEMKQTFPQGGYFRHFESASVDGGGRYDPFWFQRKEETHAAMGVRRVCNSDEANMKKIVLGDRAYLILSRYLFHILHNVAHLFDSSTNCPSLFFSLSPFFSSHLIASAHTHTRTARTHPHTLSTSSILRLSSALLLFFITLLRCCWLFSHHLSNAGSSTLLVYSITVLLPVLCSSSPCCCWFFPVTLLLCYFSSSPSFSRVTLSLTRHPSHTRTHAPTRIVHYAFCRFSV